MKNRIPTKQSAFDQIKRMGIRVDGVIDVGVQSMTESLISCFPDVPHILFEPIEEWHGMIAHNYKNIDYVLHKIALSDTDADSFLEISSINQSSVTHARLNNKPVDMTKCRTTICKRLDSVMGFVSGMYLLKLDVDGAEIRILEGAVKTLDFCSIVVIEAHPRDFMERSLFLTSRDFLLLDVVDLCYYDGIMRQFDMVFVNKKHLQGYFGSDFDYSKWYSYNPEHI